MPLIEFTAKDILRGKVITPDWYRIRVDNIGEAPSKDGGSTNYPVEATILYNADTGDKTFEGYPIEWNFNSKAIGFARGFLEALGTEVKEGRYDLSGAIGKELDVMIENKTFDGRIVNNVNHKYRSPRT